jgi:hypothetical protein
MAQTETMFTAAFMAQQRALAEKATERPWDCGWNWEGDSHCNPSHLAWAETPHRKGNSLAEVAPGVLADKAYMEAATRHYPNALDEIDALRAQVTELEASEAKLNEAMTLLSDIYDCPFALDEATIPRRGIEVAPQQVVGVISIGLLKYRRIRAMVGNQEPGQP